MPFETTVHRTEEPDKTMNEEAFNMSIRKFLKKVGITSQQQIEKVVREGIANGRLKGNESFPVRMRLESNLLKEPFVIEGEIALS